METKENKYYREIARILNVWTSDGRKSIEPANVKHFIGNVIKAVVGINDEYLNIDTTLTKGQKVYFTHEFNLYEGACENIFILKSELHATVKFISEGKEGWVDKPVSELCADKDYFIKHYTEQLSKLNSFGKTKAEATNIAPVNHEC